MKTAPAEQPLKISGSHADREARGQQLANVFIGEIIPLLVQVRQDFLDKEREETICGVKTFTEYCTGVLRYSASHIRNLIAGQNPATEKFDGSVNRKPTEPSSDSDAVQAENSEPRTLAWFMCAACGEVSEEKPDMLDHVRHCSQTPATQRPPKGQRLYIIRGGGRDRPHVAFATCAEAEQAAMEHNAAHPEWGDAFVCSWYSYLRIVPLHLWQANELVAQLHRHHEPIRVAKFSIGIEENGILVGAAICMRPANRALDDGTTIEVCRLVTDGIRNACSMLYGAAARIAKEMGYAKIQTYILESEPGTSLKATGWVLEKTDCGGTPQGDRTNRPNGHKTTPVTFVKKQRWAKQLSDEPILPVTVTVREVCFHTSEIEELVASKDSE